MINDNFDPSTRLNMEVALDRACKCLPDELDTYEGRKATAAGILRCTRAGHTHLDELTHAAEVAAARWVNEQFSQAKMA